MKTTSRAARAAERVNSEWSIDTTKRKNEKIIAARWPCLVLTEQVSRDHHVEVGCLIPCGGIAKRLQFLFVFEARAAPQLIGRGELFHSAV